jgi:hypothetical protein
MLHGVSTKSYSIAGPSNKVGYLPVMTSFIKAVNCFVGQVKPSLQRQLKKMNTRANQWDTHQIGRCKTPKLIKIVAPARPIDPTSSAF